MSTGTLTSFLACRRAQLRHFGMSAGTVTSFWHDDGHRRHLGMLTGSLWHVDGHIHYFTLCYLPCQATFWHRRASFWYVDGVTICYAMRSSLAIANRHDATLSDLLLALSGSGSDDDDDDDDGDEDDDDGNDNDEDDDDDDGGDDDDDDGDYDGNDDDGDDDDDDDGDDDDGDDDYYYDDI